MADSSRSNLEPSNLPLEHFRFFSLASFLCFDPANDQGHRVFFSIPRGSFSRIARAALDLAFSFWSQRDKLASCEAFRYHDRISFFGGTEAELSETQRLRAGVSIFFCAA